MDEQLPLFSASAADEAPEAGDGAGQGTPGQGPAAGLGPSASLAAAILAWREHLERENSPVNTVKAFVGDLNLAAQFVGAFKSVGQVSTRDLDNWLQWQRNQKKCSPKTYARRVTSLKSFFRWLHGSGVVAADPAAPLIQQTVLSPLAEVLSEAEIEAALEGARQLWQGEAANPTPYVLFTLLLKTGIKKGECMALALNHLDLSNPAEPVLWVRHPDPRHRYKERKLQLDPGWLPAYEAYTQYRAAYLERSERAGKIHPRREFVFVWQQRRLEYWLADISQAAGLNKQISFDMCRWTCAVRDLRAGMDETRLRQKLGVSKIQWREVGMKLRKLAGPAL